MDWKRGVLLTSLLAGCAAGPGSGPASAPAPAPVNLTGYSTAFKQGYAEGCESAGSRNRRRNEGRFKTDADYAMGWNDGFSVCGKGR